jgi:tetratricopeptide (TPR) repeat protein
VGRPQSQINDDLRQCDYAVFVLHDYWGSPTGNGHTSGTQEEWELAVELYKENKIRNIALFFKDVDPGKLKDPGDHLKPVLAFKQEIIDSKLYLFKSYSSLDEFADGIDGHLGRWLNDHDKIRNTDLSSGIAASSKSARASTTPSPGFDVWINEASAAVDSHDIDQFITLFFATKALESAKNDIEWARAKNILGIAESNLGKIDVAVSSFSEIAEKFASSIELEKRDWAAKALFNKGVTLGSLGRGDEAIAVYDDVIARFGTATELPLRDQVAKALVNKGVTLGTLGRNEEAITVYADVIARFGTASEEQLRQIADKAKAERKKLGKRRR